MSAIPEVQAQGDPQTRSGLVGRGLGPWLIAGVIGIFLFAMTLMGWFDVRARGVSGPAEVTAILWMNAIALIAALAYEIRRRPYSLHGMHLIALFLFLGAATLFQYSAGRFAVAGSVADLRDEMLPAALSVSIWLVTYLFTYELHQRFSRRIPLGAVGRFFNRAVPENRTIFLHLLAIATIAYLGIVGLLGITTRGAAERSMIDFANETAGYSGFALAFKLLNQYILRGFPLIVMLAGFLIVRRTRGFQQTLLRALLVLLVAGNLAANNPFAASRMWLVTALFGVLAPTIFRRARTGWLVVAISLGGLAILPALHESRNALTFGEWESVVTVTSPVRYLATSADGDHLGMISLAVRWVDDNGHTLGRQVLGAVLCWVPRRFWPDKPIGTGAMVTGDLGYGFTNWSMPIVAEGYVDWGYAGVAAMAALFAFVLSRGDRTYWVGRRPGASDAMRVIDVLYPFWLGCIIYFTRGDLIAAASHTSPFVLWALALGVGARGMPAQAEPPAKG